MRGEERFAHIRFPASFSLPLQAFVAGLDSGPARRRHVPRPPAGRATAQCRQGESVHHPCRRRRPQAFLPYTYRPRNPRYLASRENEIRWRSRCEYHLAGRGHRADGPTPVVPPESRDPAPQVPLRPPTGARRAAAVCHNRKGNNHKRRGCHQPNDPAMSPEQADGRACLV